MTQLATAPDRRVRWFLLAAAVVCVTTSPAFANAAFAAFYFAAFVFVFGNFFVAVVEWIGLCGAGAQRVRAAIMVPANFASGYVGLAVVKEINLDPYLQGINLITNIHVVSLITFLLLMLLGLMVELPFVALAFRSPRNWRRVVMAGVVVNAITGLGVGVLYVLVHDLSLTRYRAVPPAVVAADIACDDAFIVFHGSEGTYRMRPDGTERTLVDAGVWREPQHPTIRRFTWNDEPLLDLRETPGVPVIYEHVIGSYRFGDSEHVGIRHPLLGTSTEIRFVNVLPGDVVIFDIGGEGIGKSRGIYAISLRSRTVTFLGEGSAPVVMRTPPETPPGP